MRHEQGKARFCRPAHSTRLHPPGPIVYNQHAASAE
jgi:hypothetical protein